MWLATWTKWVLTTILLHELIVLLVLFEMLVDPRKGNEFEQATAVRAAMILVIGRSRFLLLLSLAKEMTVKAISVFEPKHMWQNGMVQKILADVFGLEERLNSLLLQLGLGTDSRE